MTRIPRTLITLFGITGSFLLVKRFQGQGLVHVGDEWRIIYHNTRQTRQEVKYAKKNIRGSNDRNRQRHRQEVIKGTIINSIADYPYTVSLLNRDSQNQEWHVCGGTLITQNIVLSAAHCRAHVKTVKIGHHVTDHIQRRNQFRERSTFRSGRKNTRHQRRKTIELDDKAFIMHPGYDPGTGENDFMLILLPENLDGTPFPHLNSEPYVPNAYMSEKDKRVVVLGWGVTQDGDVNSASEVLLKANLNYVNNYVCGWAYGAQHIKTNMLCAHSNTGRDACNGDSGGPLIIQHRDDPGQDILVGVVSWGATCGSSKYPGVYARVSSAYRWINNVICNELSPESCEEHGEIRTFQETNAPSQQPSYGPTRSLDTKVTSSQCKDYNGYFYITRKRDQIRNCEWVGKAKHIPKLWYRCLWFGVWCLKTCGRCPK